MDSVDCRGNTSTNCTQEVIKTVAIVIDSIESGLINAKMAHCLKELKPVVV